MNERIQELIAQATSRPHRDQGFNGEPTHVYPGTLDPEKLAQLIVQECVSLFDGTQEIKTVGVLTHSQVVRKIKKHFGVTA